MDSRKRVVIATLAYYDIFDYPLTLDEIVRYQSGETILAGEEIAELLSFLPAVKKKNDYYFLRGREQIVAKRLRRNIASKIKEEKSLTLITLLRFLPTIRYVGISGSLAMRNAEKEDDIDLFIISTPHNIWMTRFLVSIFFRALRKLRLRNDGNAKDKFCINMIIDEGHMQFDAKRKNLYTAHELIQLRTCVNKHDTYEKLLQVNKWIIEFLPATRIRKTHIVHNQIFNMQPNLLEWFFQTLQMAYMKKKITNETIQEGFLAFHPRDYTGQIIKKFHNRLKKYAV